MKTYVVMPSFIVTEELQTLATNAIKSFKEHSDVTLISVDDGSPMDTKFLKRLSDVYLRNRKNSGFGPTCNKGFGWIFKHEPEDCYILCANNDIRIHDKVLPALKFPFENFENVAITGILSSKENTIFNQPIETYEYRKITEGGLNRDWMQDGGLWMSKKSILQKIGIFDEQFLRGGFEDVDLFLRARDTFGMKIVMSGYACYWHKQGATRWNCEKNGFINNFGRESKSIEQENYTKFLNKWRINPHTTQVWRESQLFNNL
jgi:GT2 family glycosyltransferase